MKNVVKFTTSLDFLQHNVYAILADLITLKIREVTRLICWIIPARRIMNWALTGLLQEKKLFNNGGLLCHCGSKEGHFNFGP